MNNSFVYKYVMYGKNIPPLKTVVLCNSGHLGSMIVLNKLMRMKCYNITAIVRTDHIHFSRKGLKKMKKQIWRSGALVITMLVMQQLVQELFFRLPFINRKTKTSTELQGIHGFAVHDTESINNKETIEFIKEHQPDIIISSYFPQILKKQVLQIARLGVLNVHPGLIPAYRGVMPYFRALKHNVKKAGVCVHWMDEGIDTGPIIAMKSFGVNEKWSQDKLLIKTAIVGASLLQYIGVKLQHGKEVPVISVDRGEVGYYSMPRHLDFVDYRYKRAFFSIRALCKEIIG